MHTRLFLLYGSTQKTLTAHITDESELIAMARKLDSEFNASEYATEAATLEAAEKVLVNRYKTFALFAYDLDGMTTFIHEAAEAGELVGLAALKLAKDFVSEATGEILLALTEAQQKVMDRVQFPLAGDSGLANKAFEAYLAELSSIRALSVDGLYEYVENGYRIPD